MFAVAEVADAVVVAGGAGVAVAARAKVTGLAWRASTQIKPSRASRMHVPPMNADTRRPFDGCCDCFRFLDTVLVLFRAAIPSAFSCYVLWVEVFPFYYLFIIKKWQKNSNLCLPVRLPCSCFPGECFGRGDTNIRNPPFPQKRLL
jgi:hypothetical protein